MEYHSEIPLTYDLVGKVALTDQKSTNTVREISHQKTQWIAEKIE